MSWDEVGGLVDHTESLDFSLSAAGSLEGHWLDFYFFGIA